VTADSPDPARPSGPRVYDYLLGGTDNYPADRELAKQLIADHPGLPRLSSDNRAFVLKACSWLASMKEIRQFIDVGSGLPGSPSLHEALQEGEPSSAVAYVDRDPQVICHLQCTQDNYGWRRTAVIAGDAEDPEKVLAHPALLELIDLEQPVAVVFGATLSCMDAEAARSAVAGFAGRLAPQSAVVISCASYLDQERGDAMAAAYSSACGWRSHPAADIASFFGDLELVGGMLTDVRRWLLLPDSDDREARVYGGVGIRN
jgi:hypothetical protein